MATKWIVGLVFVALAGIGGGAWAYANPDTVTAVWNGECCPLSAICGNGGCCHGEETPQQQPSATQPGASCCQHPKDGSCCGPNQPCCNPPQACCVDGANSAKRKPDCCSGD